MPFTDDQRSRNLTGTGLRLAGERFGSATALILLLASCGSSSGTGSGGAGGHLGSGGTVGMGGSGNVGGTPGVGGDLGSGGGAVGSGGTVVSTGGTSVSNGGTAASTGGTTVGTGGVGGKPGVGGKAGAGGKPGVGGKPGAGGTQGTGGQGGRMGGNGGAGSAVCGTGAASVFCEDFEKPLGPEWDAYNGTFNNGCAGHSIGVGQRDTSRSHSGLTSWHANVNYIDLESCQAELRRSVTVPTPDVFVRMFVYLPPSSAKPAITSFEMSMLSKTRGGFGAIGPTINAGTMGFDAYGDNVTFNPDQARDAGPFPTNTWVCVEWQLHQAAKSTVTGWRDGVQVVAATTATLPTSDEALDGIFFGIYGYNNTGPVDIWMDDVALSATRIGCEAP